MTIDERMVRLETEMGTQTTMLERIDHTINGNGKPGMIIDVDRLKRLAVFQAKIGYWIGATVGGILLHDLWRLITSK
jgi:hypothetical protein